MNSQVFNQLNQTLKAQPLPEGVKQVVLGEGNPTSRVMFIGHSPSGSDDQTGKPYSGPAGDIFNDLLTEADLTRQSIYLSNLVKVWTWKDERGQKVNRTPTMKEIKAWLLFIEQEIETIKPVAIVALGGTTAQFLLGKDFKITSSGNRWLEIPDSSPYLKVAKLPEPKPLVMGMAQPSYLIHLQDNAPESYAPTRANLIEALKKVKRVQGGEIPQMETVSSEDEVPF
jgi:uracil-DNA glycosylase